MLSSGNPLPGFIFAHDNLLSVQDSQLSSAHTPIWKSSRSTSNRKGRPLVYARCHSPLVSSRLITSRKCVYKSSLVSTGKPMPLDSWKSEGNIQRGTVAQSHKGATVVPSKSIREMIFPDSLSIYHGTPAVAFSKLKVYVTLP